MVSPFPTDRATAKSPALNSVAVVSSFVADPPILMNAPATVPLPVILNATAADVLLDPALAAEKEGAGLLPEYVGALAPPTSLHPACEACVSPATAEPEPLRPITTAPAAALPRILSSSRFLPTVVTRLSNDSRHFSSPSGP